MPALLLAGLWDGSGNPMKSQTGGPDMASMPNIILEGLAKKYLGALAPAAPGYMLMVFEKAPSAISCALAAQARFADYNKGKSAEKLACVRLGIHCTPSANGAIPDKDAKALSLMQEITPAGRVFVTRPAFTQSHGAQACAFIPLGIEYFSGLPEPLDLLEAIPVVGATRTLSPIMTTGSMPQVARPATAPPAVEEAAAPALPMFAAFGDPTLMAGAAVAGLLLSLMGGLLLTLLSPVDLLDWVFHFAGHTMFSLGGEGDAMYIGALAVQVAAPFAIAAHCWLHSRPVAGQAALFWLGQSLFSIGGHWAAPGSADASTFGGCVKNDGMVLAQALGIVKHYNAWAHLCAFLGCWVMAAALAGFYIHLKGRDPAETTG